MSKQFKKLLHFVKNKEEDMKILGIIEYFRDYVGYDNVNKNYPIEGIIKFAIDAVLVLMVITAILIYLIKHTKKKVFLIAMLSYLVVYIVVSFIGLEMFQTVLSIGLIIIGLIIIVNYAPEFKNQFIGLKHTRSEKGFLSTEETKEELIDTLLKTVEHLTSRKIGAIITIEKEHSLNAYIDKAIKLESLVSFELLDTIFCPNTALHDGAVIIRGNHIMCAGAFYPSSENSEIPKHYGSRHRAAIGISEITDAFTIVLSEETGRIATTIAGTITGNTTLDSLRISLKQNIIVK